MKKFFITFFILSFLFSQDTLKSNIPLVGEKFIKAGNIEYYSRISDIFGLLPVSFALNLYSTNQIGKAGKIVLENDIGFESEFGKNLINYKFNKNLYPISFLTGFAIIGSMNTSKSKGKNIIPIAWITYGATVHFSLLSLRNLNKASKKLIQFSKNNSNPYFWEAGRNFENYYKINLYGTSMYQLGIGTIIYYALKINYFEESTENNYLPIVGYTSILTGILLNKFIAPWFLRTSGQYLVKSAEWFLNP